MIRIISVDGVPAQRIHSRPHSHTRNTQPKKKAVPFVSRFKEVRRAHCVISTAVGCWQARCSGAWRRQVTAPCSVLPIRQQHPCTSLPCHLCPSAALAPRAISPPCDIIVCRRRQSSNIKHEVKRARRRSMS